MCRGKTLLITAVVLAMVSIANAELTLTVNGLDAIEPLEIEGRDNLVIAIAGQSEAKAQDMSVTCDNGKLDALTKPNKPARKPTSGRYLFTFADVFGIDKEALAPPQPKPELELQAQSKQQISTSQTAEPAKSYSASSSGGRTTGIDNFPEPNSYPDLDSNDIVNFVDFAIFAENRQKSGSGLDGDFDNSGTVDANDLGNFCLFLAKWASPNKCFRIV